jgi:hypothetical protein
VALPDLVRERIAAELERQSFALEVLRDLHPERQEMLEAWIAAMTEGRRNSASGPQGLTG